MRSALFLLLLLSGPVTWAQQTGNGTIAGRVADASSGEALPLVNISLSDPSFGTSADLDGRFLLQDVPPGTYTLKASFVGYEDFIQTGIEVAAGSRIFLSVQLEYGVMLNNEVVVTASARSQAINLAPASLAVITAKQMQERQITTFDQAFDEVPGVVVTRSGNANVQAFSIRGASEVAGGGIGNRVLLLIDGRPALSPESGGALWNLVPVSSIERIEVVRGAYSSLYGSGAMGGVVNVITKKTGSKPETRVHANYGAYHPAQGKAGYPGYHDFKSLELSRNGQQGIFSYVLDGNWRKDDGYREKTAFQLFNFYGKGTWNFKPGHLLQVSANFNGMHSDAPATWLSFREPYRVADFKKDDFQDRREYNADILYQAPVGKQIQFSSRFYQYGNFSDFTFDTTSRADVPNVNFGKQIVRSYNVQTRRLGNVTQLNMELGKRHYLIAGLDMKWDYVLGKPEEFLYGEHRVLSSGAYLQDEISFGSNLTVTAGLRYDHYHIVGQVSEYSFSPKLAAVYRLNRQLSLRALTAQAFRDPPIAERFIKFEQGGGLRFAPNPNLRPERLTFSAELGAQYEPARGLLIDAALFYNQYENLISFQQLSAPLEPLLYQVVNLKTALMQGFEFSANKRWDNGIRLSLSYTFLDARDTSPDRVNDALAYKVRHTLGASAGLERGKWLLALNARYRSRIEEVFIYPGSEPDAVFVADSKLTFKASERLSCYLAVNNVNNARYEELERYRMPGRSFTIGCVGKF